MFRLLDRPYYTDKEITIVLKGVYAREDDVGIKRTYRYDIKLYGEDVTVGYVDLRVGDSEYLFYMGHIGYRIEEEYRGHHYAEKAVRLVLNQARKEKMETVIITCSPENIASYKTITNLKAKLLGTYNVPEWHELYKYGELSKCVFELKIKEK